MKSRYALALAMTMLCHVTGSAHEYYVKSFTVIHPWAEQTKDGASTADVFAKFEQISAGDKLISAHTTFANKVELRDSKDVLTKRPIVLEEGKTLELQPGTPHLTMVGLKEPLQWGRSYPMTLVFEKSGPVAVMISIGAH